MGYFILSVLMFFGGVLLKAEPPDGISASAGNIAGDPEDTPSDPDDAEEPSDQADSKEPAEPSDLENPPDHSDAEDDSQAPTAYYYSLLDDTRRGYYDQLSEAVASEEESVVLSGITYEEADPIFVSVQYDHPEYFWVEGSYTYKSGDNYVEFIFNYNCSGEEKEKRESVIEQQAEEILAEAPADGTDYEKVKYVFETLVDRTEYDLEAPENQNIYSVFGNWTSVCAGYARATKYLLDRMGVECIYVTGNAENEAHAWNIVSCGGKYYCVDTTWGDPAYQEGIGVDIDTTSYEYLCCPDSMLSRTHTADSAFEIPECTDNSLEYYRLQGRYLESSDQGKILEIMKKDIDEGEDRTDIQFATQEVFNQLMPQLETVIQEALQYEQSVKGNQGSVNYQYNENTCRISVFWKR